jgi:hypothetical protein
MKAPSAPAIATQGMAGPTTFLSGLPASRSRVCGGASRWKHRCRSVHIVAQVGGIWNRMRLRCDGDNRLVLDHPTIPSPTQSQHRQPCRNLSGLWETPGPPHNQFPGFESWRTSVWGAEAVTRLGLWLLPSLAERDLVTCWIAWMQKLGRSRSRLSSTNSSRTAFTLWLTPIHTIRLANIAEAVRLARFYSGGTGEVVIW